MRNGLNIDDYIEIFQTITHEVLKILRTKGKRYVYVEATHKDINNGKEFIGLFRGGYTVGKGHCMGWYAVEYLRFTRCLSVNGYFCNKFLSKLEISSMLNMKEFRAKNDAQARLEFSKLLHKKE